MRVHFIEEEITVTVHFIEEGSYLGNYGDSAFYRGGQLFSALSPYFSALSPYSARLSGGGVSV